MKQIPLSTHFKALIVFVFAFTTLTTNTNRANAHLAPTEQTPPANFFKFPFPTGRAWRMSGGPHPYNGTSGTFTSIDFKPSWHSGCSLPNNNKDWVVAAASGTVIYNSNQPYMLKINHGNGWTSEYMHIDKIQVTSGTVQKDQKLGYPSCKGGNADGAHVHFTLYYNGTRQSIIGVTFEGWKVQNTSTRYEGCLKHEITQGKVCRQLYPVSETPTTVFRSMRAVVEIRSMYGEKKAMTIQGDSLNDFADIIQSKWTGRSSQKWYLIPLDGNDLGYYMFKSLSSGKCFDIRDMSLVSGAALQQFSCTNNGVIFDNRKFKFTSASSDNSKWYIQAKQSLLFLEAWGTGDITIQQKSKTSEPKQHWVLTLK